MYRRWRRAAVEVSASAEDRVFVAARVKASGSSFYWAMRLLPSPRRRALFAVYAFCRAADDLADDESSPVEERRRRLGELRETVGRLFDGESGRDSLERVLKDAIDSYSLDRADLHAVLDGMESDAAGPPPLAPTWEVLDLYCDRAACAVGRMCLAILGLRGEEARRLARAAGRALQLTNILRDVHEDARRGRLYLPLEIARARGVPTTSAEAATRHPRFPSAWRDLAACAGAESDRAFSLLATLPKESTWAMRIMLDIYRASLRRMLTLDDHELLDPHRRIGRVGRVERIVTACRHAFGRGA